MKLKYLHCLAFTVLLGAGGLSAQGQNRPSRAEEDKILEDIRSGRLQVTDEMINMQRELHPELRSYTNQQIRDKLMARARQGKQDTSRNWQGDEDQNQWQQRPGGPGDWRRGRTDDRGRMDDSVQLGRNPFRDTAIARQRDTTNLTLGKSRFPEGLKRFGYDFFANNQFNAGASGAGAPSLPEYVLSPGDEIQVYTWGRETQNQTVTVDNEGMFQYPPLAPMRVSGMRFSDAQKKITSELEKINGIKASVGMGRLKSIRVMVLGEAMSPGSYVVPAGATVTSALFQSGGISEIGSLRSITVRRGGRTIASLDLYDMLLKGSSRGDIQLLSGDAVFIPVADIQVAVTGMVKRPAIYEVKPGTKVLDVLELGGGLSSNAFKGRVRLDRVESHKRKVVLDIQMEKVGGSSNPQVMDGDILFVDQVLDKEDDVVYLKGNVNRPGRFEFKKGMNIRDLIPSVKDLKSETFFTYGHIKRATDDGQGSLLLPFSLKEVFDNNANVPLMPRDTVIIYSRYDLMDQPQVCITGIVRRPGWYPFVDKMRVSDLIIAGGGLMAEAYLPEAHVIRLLKVQESDSLFSTLIKVKLSNLIDNPGDENNVELHPSDSLIIFPRGNFILPKSVSVHGSVKKDGEFQLTQNMGIPELISQAEGLTRTTYKVQIEVIRQKVENDSVVKREIHRINLKDVMEGRTKFDLQDGDAVYIRDVVNHDASLVMTIAGEFNFPGKYQVAKGEKLSSVIRRAGGFTPTAYLRAAVFIRKSVKQRQLEAIDEISRRLDDQLNNLLAQTTNEKDRATVEQAIANRKGLLDDVRNAPYLGRIVVDLDRDFKFAGGEEDLTVEDGDSLYIRPLASTVSIMGEVFSPTNVVVGGKTKTIGDCLNVAGGVSEFGDPGNVYYLRPDGVVATPKNTTFFTWKKVEAGGTIVVPPKGPKKDYLDALTKITQIIYQIAISVGVAKTVF